MPLEIGGSRAAADASHLRMTASEQRSSSRQSHKTHRDLIAWQASMRLLVEAYRVARQLPDLERYGLASQLRRAAVSIPANIAEGFGRSTRGDYLRHLSIALGSFRELQPHLKIIPLLTNLCRAEVTSTRSVAVVTLVCI